MDAKIDYVVTLVHGTWARKSGWPNAGSILRQSLSEELGAANVKFFPFGWTGANKSFDRVDASSTLVENLEAQVEQYPDAAHFVICHSHGGNVAAYAAKNPSLQRQLSGVVCFNTPFISPISRGAGHLLHTALLWVSYTCAALSLLGLLYALFGQPLQNFLHSMLYLSGVFFFGSAIHVLRKNDHIIRYVEAQEDKIKRRISLPDLKYSNILSIYSVNDEVFNIFRIIDSISIIGFIFYHKIIIISLFIIFLLGDYFRINVFLWSFYGFDISNYEDWIRFQLQYYSIIDLLKNIYENKIHGGYSFILFSVAKSLFYACTQLLIFTIWALVPILVFSISQWFATVGLRGILSDCFLLRPQLGLSPLQAGRTEYWEEKTRPKGFLFHSAAYDNPETLKKLAQWMKINRNNSSGNMVAPMSAEAT